MIEIKQENRVILNKDSTAQYLAKRLKVPENTIYYINSKYPTMLRVSPTKLKEILDFLLEEGFRPSHILGIPRVFTHSISTLKVIYETFIKFILSRIYLCILLCISIFTLFHKTSCQTTNTKISLLSTYIISLRNLLKIDMVSYEIKFNLNNFKIIIQKKLYCL